jgi:hypothetical protein
LPAPVRSLWPKSSWTRRRSMHSRLDATDRPSSGERRNDPDGQRVYALLQGAPTGPDSRGFAASRAVPMRSGVQLVNRKAVRPVPTGTNRSVPALTHHASTRCRRCRVPPTLRSPASRSVWGDDLPGFLLGDRLVAWRRLESPRLRSATRDPAVSGRPACRGRRGSFLPRQATAALFPVPCFAIGASGEVALPPALARFR